jgi:hypothetical protein
MASRRGKTPKTASQRLAKSLRASKRQGGKLVSLRLSPQAAVAGGQEVQSALRHHGVTMNWYESARNSNRPDWRLARRCGFLR